MFGVLADIMLLSRYYIMYDRQSFRLNYYARFFPLQNRQTSMGIHIAM